jgi:acetoin utilization protein AcuB
MPFAVERFMTRTPHTIGRDQTLATAHRLMRTHDLRHLPVLEGGALVGVVSQRDLFLLESLTGVDLETVPVAEAMTMDVEVVDPRTPLQEVATIMARKKIGSIIVAQGKRIVGIFTVTDALRALALLLDAPVRPLHLVAS